MRDIRRTAWILLSSFASVADVERNVLTVAFDSEGNAKGFASSGSDGYLADVVQSMFGVRPVIRSIIQPGAGKGGGRPVQGGRDDGSASTDTGPGGRGARGGGAGGGAGDSDQPAGAPRPAGPSGAVAAGEGQNAGIAGSGRDRPRAGSDSVSGRPGPETRGPAGGEARPAVPAQADLAGPGAAGTGAAGTGAAGPGQPGPGPGGTGPGAAGEGPAAVAAGPAAGQATGQNASPSGSGPAQGRSHSAGAAAARAALADAAGRPGSGPRPRNVGDLTDDPRPQTDSEPPGPAGELTGTDLIMRELGGQVIEELRET